MKKIFAYALILLLLITKTNCISKARADRIDTHSTIQIAQSPIESITFNQINNSLCALKKMIESQIDIIDLDLESLFKFQEYQNHQGQKENYTRNNGTGQSAQVFFDVPTSDAIGGTRTADNVFTRSSGTFETPIITGNVTAATATTVTLGGGASSTNDFYNTNIISITSGTGSGQIRTITDYVGGTKVATIDTAWTTNPDATSTYEIVSGIYVGQYAFTFNVTNFGVKVWPPIAQPLSSISSGRWLPIIQNTSTSLVVDGTLTSPGTGIIISLFNPEADLYPHEKTGLAFSGGVFDGKSLWLSPYLSPDIVKVNPATGHMTSFPHNKNVIRAFGDAVYDGENVWLIPYSSRDIIKISSDETITSFAHGKGNFAFWGGTFDGSYIWFSPQNSPDILKIEPSTNEMTSIPHNQGNFAFLGAVFDGCNVWLVPQRSSVILKINPITNAITEIPHGKGDFAFAGGVFDGKYVWMIPFSSPDFIRINPLTNTIESFPHDQGAFAFLGGSFDGKSIWAAPQFSPNIIKINPITGAMETYPHGQGNNFIFWGSIFDGSSVWLVPANSAHLWRLLPPEYDKSNLNIARTLTVGSTFEYAGALIDASIQFETPLSGDSLSINQNTDLLLMNPAGPLAAISIAMPSNPQHGQIVTIASNESITAVTLTNATINGAITTLASNGFAKYIFEESTNSWFRIG